MFLVCCALLVVRCSERPKDRRPCVFTGVAQSPSIIIPTMSCGEQFGKKKCFPENVHF